MNNWTNTMPRRSGLYALLASLVLTACAPGPSRRPGSTPQPAPTVQPSAAQPSTENADVAAPLAERFAAALELMKSRQYESARDALLALSTEFPKLSGPKTDLGIVYAQLDQPGKALEQLKSAVSLKPDNAIAWNWIGILQREAGQYGAAEQAYQKALQARPDYADAQFNLAILYDLAMNKPLKALQAYQGFQKLTREEDLIVSAWIRKIESGLEQSSTTTHLAEVSP